MFMTCKVRYQITVIKYHASASMSEARNMHMWFQAVEYLESSTHVTFETCILHMCQETTSTQGNKLECITAISLPPLNCEYN